jgi:hypothetical protein
MRLVLIGTGGFDSAGYAYLLGTTEATDDEYKREDEIRAQHHLPVQNRTPMIILT